MGWDITYHPVAADEIKSIYFRGIEDENYYQTLSKDFALDEQWTEALKIIFEEGRNIGDATPFNLGHPFCLAVMLGNLRPSWYIRGGALSFIANESCIKNYIADWRDLVPANLAHLTFENQLTENYCGGVFLTAEAVKGLRKAYEANNDVKVLMDDLFSHGRLEIFWRAVDYAIANNLGLLEATEVIEPNPFNLDETRSLINLSKCDPDGVILYSQAAMEQMAQVLADNKQAQQSQDTTEMVNTSKTADDLLTNDYQKDQANDLSSKTGLLAWIKRLFKK